MYSGSNDPSYMIHIICVHYNTNYGCGKCLNEVLTTGQLLKAHMNVCTHASLEKKKCMSKDPSPGSRPPPPQSSQESSQASPHWSQHPKISLFCLLRSQTPVKGRRNAPPTTNTVVRTNPARSPVWTNPARKSPTRSLARNLTRGPARMSPAGSSPRTNVTKGET